MSAKEAYQTNRLIELKCWLVRHELTQPKVARQLGITRQYLSDMLYTNGTQLMPATAVCLSRWGVHCLNVGLHRVQQFDSLISQVQGSTSGLPLRARFHAQIGYEKQLTARWPDTEFRFWKPFDCDRENEHRVVLEWPFPEGVG